jgi:hypothetical protein
MTRSAESEIVEAMVEAAGPPLRGSEAGFLTERPIRQEPVSPLLIYRTLRPLRFSQLGCLVMRRMLRRRSPAAKLGTPVDLRHFAGKWPFPDWDAAAAKKMLATREFTFLNQTVRCHSAIPRSTREREFEIPDSEGRNAIPWNDRRYPKLWLYHLNYCDFLNARFALPEEERLLNSAVDIALDWRRQNARGTEVGWEPYALSVRIVNWLKFLARYGPRVELLRGTTTLRALLQSVGNQAATLEWRLEKDLLGNHLLKNIKALLFAGAFLETPRSSRWWAEGEKLLRQELDEQILPDGGHFERSPMYHVQVLEDLADIERLCAYTGRRLRCADLLARKGRSMARLLKGLVHPDGAIPLFNDSALGGSRPASDLLARSSVKEIEAPTVTLFPHTGYGVIRDGERGSALIFDCGPLGPDYQPGHGHCDVLSYELSLHGQRVVVDSGVSTYEATLERIHERSTAAHNTLRIDSEDQAEVWASFRVGRRPKVGRLEGGTAGPFHYVGGEHYAYQHRGVVHVRRIALMSGGVWVVIDLLKGRGHHRAESFIHFHPLVGARALAAAPGAAKTAPQHRWLLDSIYQTYSLVAYGAGEFSLYQSWYAEEFGNRQRSNVLRWTWEGNIPWIMAYAFVPEGIPTPKIVGDARNHTVDINGRLILLG